MMATCAGCQQRVSHLERTLIFASENNRLELPNLEAQFSLTTHKMPTLAVCVSISGCRVTYCADTGPTWSIPSSFMRPDLAKVECTLEWRDNGGSEFHLDARGWRAVSHSNINHARTARRKWRDTS